MRLRLGMAPLSAPLGRLHRTQKPTTVRLWKRPTISSGSC